jgi:hypothetical protein
MSLLDGFRLKMQLKVHGHTCPSQEALAPAGPVPNGMFAAGLALGATRLSAKNPPTRPCEVRCGSFASPGWSNP